MQVAVTIGVLLAFSQVGYGRATSKEERARKAAEAAQEAPADPPQEAAAGEPEAPPQKQTPQFKQLRARVTPEEIKEITSVKEVLRFPYTLLQDGVEGEYQFTLRDGVLKVEHFRTNRMGFVTPVHDHRDATTIMVPFNFKIGEDLVLLADELIGNESIEVELPKGMDTVSIQIFVLEGSKVAATFDRVVGYLADTGPKGSVLARKLAVKEDRRAKAGCGGIFAG